MALTGTLTADFSSFQTAVAQAEVSLKSFESGAGKVETSLTRMADSFSGRKIIQDATLMAEVFNRAGGAASFTEKELQRMGVVGSEALEKLRVNGQPIPANLQAMADATKRVDVAHSGLTDTVKKLALSFGALFTVRAAFNFVKDILADASALQDLSNQTHIGVEDIQILAGAISEFGVDADTLAKGLYTLSRKVAGGDDSVAKALATMGMSLQDVAGLNGEELFLKIERGLSKLQGGLRDDTSAELFGSRLGMAMAGASDGIDGAIATARELNTVMSKESVKALDAYGESIDRANRSLTAMAANMVGPVAQGFNVLFDAASKGASLWDLALGLLPKGLGAVGTGTAGLATVLDHLNQVQAQVVVTTTEVSIEQGRLTLAGKDLADVQRLVAQSMKQVDLDFAAAAHQLGLTVNQENIATARANDLAEAEEKTAAAARKAAEATDVWDSSLRFTSETIEKAIEQIRTLSGEMVTLEELEKRHAAGGSTTYDLSTAEGRRNVPPDVAALLHDGYNFAQAMYLAYAMKMGFAPNMNEPLLQVKGPRVPGFAGGVQNFSGGLAMVGERGPELVSLPKGSSVFPSGRGGGTMNVAIYVNGTAEDVARKVAAELNRLVMRNRQLGLS